MDPRQTVGAGLTAWVSLSMGGGTVHPPSLNGDGRTGRWIIVALVVVALVSTGVLWLLQDVLKREFELRWWRRRWKGTGYPRWDR